MFLAIFTGVFLILYYTNNLSWLPFENHGQSAKVDDQIELIEVDVSSASTTMIPEDRHDIQAKLDGKGKVTVKEDGDKITIEMKRKWFNWFPFFNKSDLTIFVPEDYDEQMEIEIGSGNLTFDGKSMDLKKLKLDVGSGNIRLNNIDAKTFEHDGSSGNVTIDSLKTNSSTFDLSSGNVNVKHFIGKMDADLSSGSFKIQMDQLMAPVKIGVSSGNVKLDLPNDADFILNGDVSSGKIDSDFDLKDVTDDKHHLNGTYGSGKYPINLNVSSGHINVY